MQTDREYVIEVKNLTKSYGRNEVLKGIDLQVERGTMLALLGPNGAGKTTTVRILSTLLGFDGGTVLVDGHDVRTAADKVRAVIGLTGQAAAVDELLTGRENLVMMGQLYRLTAASARVRAKELLAEFDLVEAAGRPAAPPAAPAPPPPPPAPPRRPGGWGKYKKTRVPPRHHDPADHPVSR